MSYGLYGKDGNVVAINRVKDIFDDARAQHQSALERIAAGDIRDAAEKAWCATKRATDALILARTGREPESSTETSSGLRQLSGSDARVRSFNLVSRYYTRQGHLHGDCFYCGLWEPIDDTERRITETSDYIRDAEQLA